MVIMKQIFFKMDLKESKLGYGSAAKITNLGVTKSKLVCYKENKKNTWHNTSLLFIIKTKHIYKSSISEKFLCLFIPYREQGWKSIGSTLPDGVACRALNGHMVGHFRDA